MEKYFLLEMRYKCSYLCPFILSGMDVGIWLLTEEIYNVQPPEQPGADQSAQNTTVLSAGRIFAVLLLKFW